MTAEAPALRAFLDAANKLRFLDLAEFHKAIGGTDAQVSRMRWENFESDPIRWLSRAPDAEAEALWSVAMREGG